jgi:hypothetical protein
MMKKHNERPSKIYPETANTAGLSKALRDNKKYHYKVVRHEMVRHEIPSYTIIGSPPKHITQYHNKQVSAKASPRSNKRSTRSYKVNVKKRSLKGGRISARKTPTSKKASVKSLRASIKRKGRKKVALNMESSY